MSEKQKEEINEEISEATETTSQEAETSENEDANPEEEISVEDQLRDDLSKEKEKFLRLFAEFENYKKRTSKERIELFKTAGQEVIVSLLPVLDDFERANKELAKAEDEELFKGIGLIQNKLKEILKSKGLQEIIINQGDTFDAEVHDAITQIAAPSKKLKGKIIDVIEKGFSLGDKIIRHPKVVVGK